MKKSVKKRSPITTHILDISKGKPAAGVKVVLQFFDKKTWKVIAAGVTDADGRIENLLDFDSKIKKGTYRLNFLVGKHFKNKTFYPYAEIAFQVVNTSQHYHVPLLLSPYGYSTYRGT